MHCAEVRDTDEFRQTRGKRYESAVWLIESYSVRLVLVAM